MAPPLLFNQFVKFVVFPKPSHSTIVSWATAVIVGSEVSIIIKRAVVLTALPQSSVAVNTTLRIFVVSLLQFASSGTPKPL